MSDEFDLGLNIKRQTLGISLKKEVKMENCTDNNAFGKALDKVFGP